MRRLLVIGILLTAAFTFSDYGRAARDRSLAPVSSMTRELIVLEIEDCPICTLMRSQVAPAYARTPRAMAVPMRFVSLDRIQGHGVRLSAPVTVLPTVVLMRDGVEVDRITGYLGTENFLQVVASMIGSVD